MKKPLNDGLVPFDIFGNMVYHADDLSRINYEYSPYFRDNEFELYKDSPFYIRTSREYVHWMNKPFDKHVFRYNMRNPTFYAELKPVDVLKMRSATLMVLHDRDEHKYYSRVEDFIRGFSVSTLTIEDNYISGMWTVMPRHGYYSIEYTASL